MSISDWVLIIVAVIAASGAWLNSRFGRIARLEQENRELWWVCKQLLHTLYINGIEPESKLTDLINGKDQP